MRSLPDIQLPGVYLGEREEYIVRFILSWKQLGSCFKCEYFEGEKLLEGAAIAGEAEEEGKDSFVA